MMFILRDDPVIEVFDDPQKPPNWIEVIDIENREYQFCNDQGQRYVGVITGSSGWVKQPGFILKPEGDPDLKNALDLIDQAEMIEPNVRFSNLMELREYITNRKKSV
jgi:hypothetical protein